MNRNSRNTNTQHRYVYPKNKYFNRKIPAGDALRVYLNDYEKNCSPDRKLNGNRQWNRLIKPHLLRMCDILPNDQVKGVFGPYMFAEFKGTLRSKDERRSVEKTITLFGEFHDPNHYKNIQNLDFQGVIPIHSYIKMLLLSNPNKIYDLYMETSIINGEYLKKKSVHENFSLSLLGQQFENCFQLDKSRCEYKNIRTHYTDVRRFKNTVMYLSHFNSLLEQKIREQKTLAEKEKDWLQIYEIFWQGIILGIPNLKSQLVDNDSAGVIKEFVTQRLIEIRGEEDLYFGLTESFKIKLEQLVLDIYILGRLTKNKNFNTQQNIIIYTGGMHTRLYINFFKYIGFSLGQSYNIKELRPGDFCPPIVYFDRKYNKNFTQNQFRGR